MRQRWDEELAGSFLGLALLLAIVSIIATVWLVIKAFELLFRVGFSHPDNRALQIAGGIAGGAIVLAALLGERFPVLIALAGLSLLALLATAKAVELYYDERLQPEVSRDYVLDQVLHQPWWSTEAA